MSRVFGVNQFQQRQFLLARFRSQVRRIDGGARHTCQFALPGQRQGFGDADPVLTLKLLADPGLFFEPIQFHLQPPDLGIQTLRTGRRIGRLRAALGIKQAGCLL